MFFSNYLIGGGAEKTILNLLNYINNNFKSVNAYYCACFHNEEVEKNNRNIVVLQNSCNTNDSIPIKIIKKLRIIHELKLLKKKLNIDTSISFLPGNDWINLFSGIGERKIASIRNTESIFITSKLTRLFFRLIWNQYDKVVAISKAVEYDLIDSFGVAKNKVMTIYNPAPIYEKLDMQSVPYLDECKEKIYSKWA